MFHVYRTISEQKLFAFVAIGKRFKTVLFVLFHLFIIISSYYVLMLHMAYGLALL